MNRIGKEVKIADRDLEFIWCEIKARLCKHKVIKALKNTGDPELGPVIEYLQKNSMHVFPYDYKKEYRIENVNAGKDEESGLLYVEHGKQRLYMRRAYTSLFRVKRYYNNILIEQDSRSPHCYTTDDFVPDEGAVILDIGGAEGIFSLQFMDRVKKVYIFECDEGWTEALKKTYADYKDKVVVINKFVSNCSDDAHVSLDDFIKENNLENEKLFIKVDAEGSEPQILAGAERLIASDQKVQWAICVYHCESHEQLVRNVFKKALIEVAQGYMLYYYDYYFRAPYFRRGVLRIRC